MRLDERAERATQNLRSGVDRDVQPDPMLRSLRRTRTRRRAAMLAAPMALALLAAAAVWSGTRLHEPAVVTRPHTVIHANGFLLGSGNPALENPKGFVLPVPIGSSPTWSPDGRQLAVLDGEIVITDVYTGEKRDLRCPECTEIAWSPDGSRFAAVERAADRILFVDATSGAITDDSLRNVRNIHSLTWSSDGRRLAFIADDPDPKPRIVQAAYIADLDSDKTQVLISGPFDDGFGQFHPGHVLAVSWRPASDELAVIVAFPITGSYSSAVLRLVALHSDGSRMAGLAPIRRCSCQPWSPNLEWSPDGTALAVYAGRDGFHPTLDGDGAPVRVRFVTGSGFLAWQPR